MYLDSDFSSLRRINLDVNNVKSCLGFPGYSCLTGDGLAVGGPEGLDELTFGRRHPEKQ